METISSPRVWRASWYALLPQSLYYFISGVWPLLNMSTFVTVTGPKTDLWLVRTVGALIAVIGVSLFMAAIRQRVVLEIAVVAIGSALVLTSIDLYYSLTRTISFIYLLDAVAELAILGLWYYAWYGARPVVEKIAQNDPKQTTPLENERSEYDRSQSPLH